MSVRPARRDPAAATSRRRSLEAGVDRLIPAALRGYREQILYLAVGGWNTLFGYVVFVVLYAFAGDALGYGPVIVVSYLLAIANAYLGYRYITFRSRGSIIRELPRFSLVYLATMVVNLVFFPVALQVLPLNPYMIQAVFTLGVVVASYLGHKHFSFKPAAPSRHASPVEPRDTRDAAQEEG